MKGVMSEVDNEIFGYLNRLVEYEGDFYRNKISKEDLSVKCDVLIEFFSNTSELLESKFAFECICGIYILLERLKRSANLESRICAIIAEKMSNFSHMLNKRCADVRDLMAMQNEEEDSEVHCYSGMSNQEYSGPRNVKQKRTNYPKKVSKTLKDWLSTNVLNPYPSETEKAVLCERTGLDQTQINNWFINARRRILPLLKQQIKKN